MGCDTSHAGKKLADRNSHFKFSSINKSYKEGTVVDVRTPEEFMEAHYPGAINIPLDQVQSRLQEFTAMQKPVIAYCRSGNRSGLAVSLLQQNGITEVLNGGGLDEMLPKGS